MYDEGVDAGHTGNAATSMRQERGALALEDAGTGLTGDLLG